MLCGLLCKHLCNCLSLHVAMHGHEQMISMLTPRKRHLSNWYVSLFFWSCYYCSCRATRVQSTWCWFDPIDMVLLPECKHVTPHVCRSRCKNAKHACIHQQNPADLVEIHILHRKFCCQVTVHAIPCFVSAAAMGFLACVTTRVLISIS